MFSCEPESRPTCDGRLGAEELVTHAVARAVPVDQALLLHAACLLAVGVSEEAVRAGADGAVALGRALRVPPADDGAGAGVLALEQPALPPHAGVLLAAVNIIAAPRLLHAKPGL